MWTASNRKRTTAADCVSERSDGRRMGACGPLIPPAKRGGNRRHVEVREVVNGIMYVLSTGFSGARSRKTSAAQHAVRLPRSVELDGTLERIHHELYVKCREQKSGGKSHCRDHRQPERQSAEKGGPASIRMATMRARRSKARSATFS